MASFIVYGDASGQVTVAAPAAAGTNTITFPAETGTLVTSASTSMPNTIVWDTTVKTSGFTAAIDGGYFCNTTSAAFTVTLPASPARGDFVVIVDYAGTSATNNITVSPNGGNINGGSANITIATNRQGITFTYIDATQGWLASSNVYGGSTPFTQPYTASYLIAAGGGGAGSAATSNTRGGGGGGAGGYVTGTTSLTSGTVYTVTVGAGGAGTSTLGNTGSIGSNSSFTGLTTALGGGYGASSSNTSGGAGASGGGGSIGGGGGSGTPGQGNSGGGSSSSSNTAGGGGGGSGGAGQSGASFSYATGADGGAGTASSITGSSVTYAAGGAGGGRNGDSPVAATANSGNGGLGGGNPNGGAGGSGVVILSVPTSRYSGTTTGSPTITTSGSNTIIRFTGSGTYTA
jgi:hypothetical protein